MKKIKLILESFLLAIIIIIALWLGAFLLRDKGELFCKLSFGEYRKIPTAHIITTGSIPFENVCTGSFVFKIFTD